MKKTRRMRRIGTALLAIMMMFALSASVFGETASAASAIDESAALKIALKNAGLSKSSVRMIEVEKESSKSIDVEFVRSSNKAEYEALTTGEVIKRIRTAMEAGCIRPCHVFDLVDEVLDRLAKIEALVKSIDLTQCAPLPWKSKLKSCEIADTGDYDGWDVAEDAKGQEVVFKSDDDTFYRDVELEDGDHDADILAICGSVNAISEIKKIITPLKEG